MTESKILDTLRDLLVKNRAQEDALQRVNSMNPEELAELFGETLRTLAEQDAKVAPFSLALGKWLYEHVAGPWAEPEFGGYTVQARSSIESTVVDDDELVAAVREDHGGVYSWRVYPADDFDIDPHGEGYATVALAQAAADEWLREHGFLLVGGVPTADATKPEGE